MINIEELIESIEKRPLMYLDQKKIDYLYYYLGIYPKEMIVMMMWIIGFDIILKTGH